MSTLKYPPSRSSIKSPWIAERLKHLSKAYTDRGKFVAKEIEKIPDPQLAESSSSEEDSDEEDEGNVISKQDIFGEEFSCNKKNNQFEGVTICCCCFQSSFWDKGRKEKYQMICDILKWAFLDVFEPQSLFNVVWLFISK